MTQELAQLLDDYFEDRISQIMIGCIGQIESFDSSKMTGTVSPLLRDNTQKNFSPVPNVKALYLYVNGFYIKPDYKKEDLVWLSFSTFDIDRSLRGERSDVTGKIFSIENCVIVSSLNQTNQALPDSFQEDGLLMGKGKNYLQVKEDSFVFRFGDQKTIIDSSGIQTEGEVTAMSKTTPVKLSIHKQAGPAGPPVPEAPV